MFWSLVLVAMVGSLAVIGGITLAKRSVPRIGAFGDEKPLPGPIAMELRRIYVLQLKGSVVLLFAASIVTVPFSCFVLWKAIESNELIKLLGSVSSTVLSGWVTNGAIRFYSMSKASVKELEGLPKNGEESANESGGR